MHPAGELLPRSFYQRPPRAVALDLLGRCLSHGPVRLRITEVEAYGGPEDTASHSRFGRTARNHPMWEDGGQAYIYLCYGLHHMLNIVTGRAGEGAAVLVRACEPLAGLGTIQARRGLRTADPALLTGPGKVAQALGLDLSFNGHPLFEPGGLELRAGVPQAGMPPAGMPPAGMPPTGMSPAGILAGPRIGVPYAAPEDQAARLRFAVAGSAWVAQRRRLAPL